MTDGTDVYYESGSGEPSEAGWYRQHADGTETGPYRTREDALAAEEEVAQ